MKPVKDISAYHLSLKADCKRIEDPNQKEISFYIFRLWKGGTSGDFGDQDQERTQRGCVLPQNYVTSPKWLWLVSALSSGQCVQWDHSVVKLYCLCNICWHGYIFHWLKNVLGYLHIFTIATCILQNRVWSKVNEKHCHPVTSTL